MENDFDVAVEVHKSVGFGYRVKVLVHDIGIFINGFIVLPPNDEHDWAVYPPLLGRAGRGKYRYTVEFNKQFPLWDEIYEACIEAVKLKMGIDDEDDLPSLTPPTREVREEGFM
jgi:hypothetical protein